MEEAYVLGHAVISLTVHGAQSAREAHEVALEYIHGFEGDPWEGCIDSRWNEMGLGEYFVRFTARAADLPRGR